MGLALDLDFCLVPLGDVLQHDDAALATALFVQRAQLQADKRLRAITPADTPVHGVGVDFTAHQALHALQVLHQVFRRHQIGPTQVFHLFRGVAHDAAEMPVEPPPARVCQVARGNADEGQRKEPFHQLVRPRLLGHRFEPLGAAHLAPEQAQHHGQRHNGEGGHGADPPGQHMHRFEHFGPVDLGHHAPVGARHRPIGRQDGNFPVVLALHQPGLTGTQCHGGGQFRVRQGQSQLHGGAAAVPQFVHEHRLVALAVDQQGLAAGAGGGPCLDHRKQEPVGRNAHQHHGNQPALGLADIVDRQQPAQLRLALRVHVEVQAHGLLGLHQPRQKAVVPWGGFHRPRHGGQHLTVQRQQVDGVVIKCCPQQRKTLQDGCQLRPAAGRIGLQAHHRLCENGIGGEHLGILVPLAQPVLDLVGLEPCNGRQIGIGIGLGFGPLDPDNHPPGQGQQQCQGCEQQNELLRCRLALVVDGHESVPYHAWSSAGLARRGAVPDRGLAALSRAPSLNTFIPATRSCACIFRLSAAAAISSTSAAFCCVT